ncbi:MAG: Ig-like domain-containing protein [Hadesarchaea archaeon]|nr:Ig-like domain-containing protein [Hadesarchaea archaeon]
MVTLAETIVVRVTGNIVKLPKDTLVKVKGDVSATGLIAGDNVTTEKEKTGLILENGDNWVTQGVATTRVGVDEYEMTAGTWIRLWINAGESGENKVVLPAGSKVGLSAPTNVELYENTEVTRAAPGPTENIYLIDPASAENQPINWMQTKVGPSTVEWVGIGDNQIASGGSLAFPFAVTTPASTNYTILVRTKDTAGNVTIKEVALAVDSVAPTVTISASPLWAKASTTVTITVTASESLAKLDNVMAAENNAPENTQISMTPNADNTVWTGTFTTSDNTARDGQGKIYVIGAQFEDLVGNIGATKTENFYVDKVKPPTPSVMGSVYGWDNLARKYTNIGEWLIEGYAQDNYLTFVDNTENMTVKVRVGTTTHQVTSGAVGYYHSSITLTEGVQEVGIQYVDKAGNVGTENVENITYDATKPTISITAPASGAIIKDSTPLITLTISDAVMGVENDAYSFVDNSGYQVLLRRDNDNTVLATLTPITDPTSDPIKSLTFENQWQTDNELPEMWYNIFVQAGDNLQKDNTYSRFKVDVTAPTVPTPATGENPLSGTTVISPNVQKTTTLTLVGTGAEAGTTVKVYLDDGTTASATATVDSTGRWTINISLTAGAITKVEVTLTDVAGNEGARYLYGYVMADGNAPTVTLGTLPETTDKSSITISGTITKDAWEDWSDITLTVQVGTGRVTVPIGAGGSYNYSLALSEGPNTIVVQATDGIGNASIAASEVIERVVTPWAIYAIILVIVALILAAIAIFGGPILRKR